MDILHLVDRIEELFNESRAVPFTRNVIVDEDKMLDIIDQMRVTVPDEVKKAQQLVAQKDRIMAQANEEASRIVALAKEKAEQIVVLAKEKAEQIVEREAIVKSAETRAGQIVAQAREDSGITRRETDDYVIGALQGMEEEVTRLLTQVRNGIRKIEEDRLHAPAPAATDIRYETTSTKN
jgi:hypothetical protein